jgi:outer membrane biosynthesis protein TonB
MDGARDEAPVVEVHPRGGTLVMEHAVGAQVAMAARATFEAAGKSTAPVTRQVAADGRAPATSYPELGREARPRGRVGGRIAAALASVAMVVGFVGGGLIVVRSRQGPQAITEKTSDAVAATAAEPEPAPVPAPSPEPAPESAPAAETLPESEPEPGPAPTPEPGPAATAAPTDTAAPQAPAPKAAPAKDPCADKTGFLLTECQRRVARERAQGFNKAPTDEAIRGNPLPASSNEIIRNDPFREL